MQDLKRVPYMLSRRTEGRRRRMWYLLEAVIVGDEGPEVTG